MIFWLQDIVGMCTETNPFLSALGEALSTNHVFINTHGLIKGCLNEDLLLAYVFNKRRGVRGV